MSINYPNCKSNLIKKNGFTHTKKQNYRCLPCGRQFVLDPEQKLIDQSTKALIRKTLLERVSLEEICRIFEVSMPWLLGFITNIIESFPQDLNAEIVYPDDEIEVAVLEADELWSYVGNKKNQQWLWLVLHSATRQIVAMHVGARDKKSAEALLAKLPEYLKKKLSSIQIDGSAIQKLFLPTGVPQLIIKNLISRDYWLIV